MRAGQSMQALPAQIAFVLVQVATAGQTKPRVKNIGKRLEGRPHFVNLSRSNLLISIFAILRKQLRKTQQVKNINK
jgi:hypothetical protein